MTHDDIKELLKLFIFYQNAMIVLALIDAVKLQIFRGFT